MKKVVAIIGPTASGKTGLSLKLAKKFHGEIVSVDSRQIYRGMDIGTAKVTKPQQKQIPHHLIDIKTPRQSYSLALFLRGAKAAIRAIRKKNHLPILVGGTGQYAYALLTGLSIPKAKPNALMRRRLEKMGLKAAWRQLLQIDPNAAAHIDPKNPRRVFRALEILNAGNGLAPLSASQKQNNQNSLILGIQISKAQLRSNINARVDAMFRQGLVAEIKKLMRKYGRRKIFRETIGYREVLDHLERKLTLQEACELIKKNTWRFQRHQYNWLRRLPVVWIKNQRQAEKKIKKYFKKV